MKKSFSVFSMIRETLVRAVVSRAVDRLLTILLGLLMAWFGGGIQGQLNALQAENAQLKSCLQAVARNPVWPTDCSTFFDTNITPGVISERD